MDPAQQESVAVKRCGWCDERPATRTLPDGDGLCAACHRHLDRETRGWPACPLCRHRFWLAPLTGWGYRCLGCGTKFTGQPKEETEYRELYRHPFIDHTG